MSLSEIVDFAERITVLTAEKGTLFKGPNAMLPLDGLYMFFEVGQKIEIQSKEYFRIARIGINEKPNNSPRRIREHYKGNINGSVFRENIGWALLNASGENPLEKYKTKGNYRKHNSGGRLEEAISHYFSEALTFKVFALDYEQLSTYEETLIAALSAFYQLKLLRKEIQFGDWLGLHSFSRQERIRRSGLWNSDGVILIDDTLSRDKTGFGWLSISPSRLRDMAENLVCRIL